MHTEERTLKDEAIGRELIAALRTLFRQGMEPADLLLHASKQNKGHTAGLEAPRRVP